MRDKDLFQRRLAKVSPLYKHCMLSSVRMFCRSGADRGPSVPGAEVHTLMALDVFSSVYHELRYVT